MDRGKDVGNQTGHLFGQPWSSYDQNLFDKMDIVIGQGCHRILAVEG